LISKATLLSKAFSAMGRRSVTILSLRPRTRPLGLPSTSTLGSSRARMILVLISSSPILSLVLTEATTRSISSSSDGGASSPPSGAMFTSRPFSSMIGEREFTSSISSFLLASFSPSTRRPRRSHRQMYEWPMDAAASASTSTLMDPSMSTERTLRSPCRSSFVTMPLWDRPLSRISAGTNSIPAAS